MDAHDKFEKIRKQTLISLVGLHITALCYFGLTKGLPIWHEMQEIKEWKDTYCFEAKEGQRFNDLFLMIRNQYGLKDHQYKVFLSRVKEMNPHLYSSGNDHFRLKSGMTYCIPIPENNYFTSE